MRASDFLRVNEEGAKVASRALSALVRQPVAVSFRHAGLVSQLGDNPTLPRDLSVAAVYLPVAGAVQGAALFCLPYEGSRSLGHALLARVPKKMQDAPELEESALKEAGNIVCGNYLAAISNALGEKAVPGLPQLALGRFGAVFDEAVGRLTTTGSGVLVEVEIDFPRNAPIAGYLMLVLEVDGLLQGDDQPEPGR
jgi:chemotaxis protein CheC